MKHCENCQQEHLGSYGSGRFCSSKCARGFSTKLKRKEINLKVSQKVSGIDSHTGKPSRIAIKNCVICNKEFCTKWNKRSKTHCSDKCVKNDPLYREKMSKVMIEKIAKGEKTNFGKSIKCTFNYNNVEIRCDSKLEYSALLYFIETFKVKNIERCTFYIPYIDHIGNNRNFIPDFIINCDDGNYVVECKHIKIGKLSEKWVDYIENSKLKQKVLENYCNEHNFKNFWYTNKTSKLYNLVCQNKININQ